MWIIKKFKEVLENLKSQQFTKLNQNLRLFYTVYTVIHHDELKSSIFDIFDSLFFNKNGSHKTYLSSVNLKTILLKFIRIAYTSALKRILKDACVSDCRFGKSSPPTLC